MFYDTSTIGKKNVYFNYYVRMCDYFFFNMYLNLALSINDTIDMMKWVYFYIIFECIF